MKKAILIIIALMLVLTVTTSCNRGDGTVTLHMWLWDDVQLPAMRAMADAFIEQHPHITVETTVFPGIGDFNIKMQSVFGTPDVPEVFWMGMNLAVEMMPLGIIQDLTTFINNEPTIDLGRLNPYMVDFFTLNGRVFGIPKDLDTFAVFFNKDLFEAAGEPFPSNNWTFQEFADTARRMTSPGVFGWANSTSDRVMYSFILANGGQIYSADGMSAVVNSPASVEAMQLVMDLMNEGVAPGHIELAEINTNMSFISGRSAMLIEGSWMISQFYEAFGDRLGIVEFPIGRAGRGSTSHSIAFATSVGNRHMEETLKFLAWLSQDEALVKQAGVTIPSSLVAANAWADVHPNINTQAFVSAFTYSPPTPLAARNAARVRSVAQEYFGNMRAGLYANAQEAMNAMANALDFAIRN